MRRSFKQIVASIPGSIAVYTALRRNLEAIRVASEFRRYSELAWQQGSLVPKWTDRFFCLDNRTQQTPFDQHYVYHTAWAARCLARSCPSKHVDISSSLYFTALVSAFVPVQHLDYRPPNLVLDNLRCEKGDLGALPFPDDSLDSLSCMHVIEHIGLGRYGDPLDPLGDAKACRELARVLAPGGTLLFVVPVGRARICFNAHRIYSFEMIVALFPTLRLSEWALIADDAHNGMIANAAPHIVNNQNYACGCFVFSKSHPS
jgi:SAM-dependent methyltransferase